MAIYRNIRISFWTDPKVTDDFTPEDKYFYLYLMTNTKTNLCGCYEISMKQMSYDTGYSKETIERLIQRFEDFHKVIKYAKATKEVFILNWYKYNWTSSEKFKMALGAEIENVKCKTFRTELAELFSSYSGGETLDIEEEDDGENEKTLNEFFNEVWKLYPIKKGKGAVSKTQKRKLKRIGYDQLKRCVDRYVEQMRREGAETRYYKNGSTFFNSGYVDFLDENYADSDRPVRHQTYRERVSSGAWE